MFIALGQAQYLGGLPDYPKATKGPFVMTDDALGLSATGPMAPGIPADQIAAVEIESSQVAASKVGAALAFGVVGALTAKGTKDRTAMVVRLKAGDVAYFQLDDKNALEVRSKVGPWLRSMGIDSTV